MSTLSEQVAALETAVAVRDRMMDDMANANLRLKQQLAAAESRVEDVQRELAVCERTRREILDDVNPRIVSARVEGAREALTRLAEEARLTDLRPHIAQYIRDVRDREYPAPPRASEGEQVGDELCVCLHPKSAHIREDGACRPGHKCWVECDEYRPRPTPQAAPEPDTAKIVERAIAKLDDDVLVIGEDTPNGGVRVGHLRSLLAHRSRPAASAEPEPRTCDYVDLMVEESSNGPFVRVKARHIATLVALASRPTASGEG